MEELLAPDATDGFRRAGYRGRINSANLLLR
jgi:hypothetical protein